MVSPMTIYGIVINNNQRKQQEQEGENAGEGSSGIPKVKYLWV